MTSRQSAPQIRGQIEPSDLGWKNEVLDDIVALCEASQSAQLCIWHRQGELVNKSFDPAPVDVFAVQKGLLAILFGIAEDKYLLEVCENMNHHIDPEWTNLSPWDEAKLGIETLLTMTTGMDDELNPLGTINETWRYNNTAYNYLKKILCVHTDLTLNQLSQAWLFDVLCMSKTNWVDRPARLPDGTPFTGLTSTAEDLAKLGMLVLNEGQYDGSQLVAAHFLKQMVKPGSEQNPAWGYCWWNNHSSHYLIPMREEKVREGNLIPEAPNDLVAARGMLMNGLYVVPSLDLVVARTAMPKMDIKLNAGFERELWRHIMRMVS